MKFLTSISAATFKRSFLAAAVAATCATSAFADPLPQFTFNPAAFCATCTTGSFTADNVQVADYATVTFGANNTFTENGYLQIIGFQVGSNVISTPGLNTAGGYSLYIPFTATGMNGTPSTQFGVTTTPGIFTNVSFTLNGAAGANVHTGGTELASGTLITGTGTTNISQTASGVTPSAALDATFLPEVAGFFTAPVPFYNMALTSFTNTTSEVTPTFSGTTLTGFNITAGGGTLNFLPQATVPEPGTLALLGLGMLGFALRKRKQA